MIFYCAVILLPVLVSSIYICDNTTHMQVKTQSIVVIGMAIQIHSVKASLNGRRFDLLKNLAA